MRHNILILIIIFSLTNCKVKNDDVTIYYIPEIYSFTIGIKCESFLQHNFIQKISLHSSENKLLFTNLRKSIEAIPKDIEVNIGESRYKICFDGKEFCLTSGDVFARKYPQVHNFLIKAYASEKIETINMPHIPKIN